jgi:hypothetical protein
MDVKDTDFGSDMIEGWRDWPKEQLGGWWWGDGEYSCHCRKCGGYYVGGKRSWNCYPCALKRQEEEVQNNLGSGI